MKNEEMYSVFRTIMDEGTPAPQLLQKALSAGIIKKLTDVKKAVDGSECAYYITEKGKEKYEEIRPLFAEFED